MTPFLTGIDRHVIRLPKQQAIELISWMIGDTRVPPCVNNPMDLLVQTRMCCVICNCMTGIPERIATQVRCALAAFQQRKWPCANARGRQVWAALPRNMLSGGSAGAVMMGDQEGTARHLAPSLCTVVAPPPCELYPVQPWGTHYIRVPNLTICRRRRRRRRRR